VLTTTSRCSQVVEWDEVKFDVRLMQRVPYEGVSRMRALTAAQTACAHCT